MFAPNRHDNLIERSKTRYPQIPFQECKINQIHQMVLYFPVLGEAIDNMSMFLCTINAHSGL